MYSLVPIANKNNAHRTFPSRPWGNKEYTINTLHWACASETFSRLTVGVVRINDGKLSNAKTNQYIEFFMTLSNAF